MPDQRLLNMTAWEWLQVAKIIDTAQESGTHADCARLAAAEKAAYPIRNEPEAALSPSP